MQIFSTCGLLTNIYINILNLS